MLEDHLYQTRQQVIDKFLHEQSSGSSTSGSARDASLARHKSWHDSEKFIADNLQEVYQKLPTLEKQIWGKMIVMEGDKRTAKAYLRHPVITVDGSDAEFDGMRIGISRFENVHRSEVAYEIFNEILQGIKLKIDPDGNIWAKRMCYSPVFLKPLYRNKPNDLFIIDQTPVKVFDIRRFREMLIYELNNSTVDRRKLEKCCLVCLKFSVDHYDLLRTPCYIILIHLVAIELLTLVLPKVSDNELSSPSSSFAVGPSTSAANIGVRAGISRTSARQGGVFKRIIRKEEEQTRQGHWQNKKNNFSFESDMDLRPKSLSREDKQYASMVDLRRQSPDQPFSFGPAHQGLSNRVLSVEHMAGRPPSRGTPQNPMFGYVANVSLPMDKARLQKRWRSQDSGIGSGSGSSNSK